jgi:Na+/proline symporter
MMMLKGLMQSLAGPAPNYDMQRVLSARTPREAAQMSGLVNVVLFVPRYMLVTGLTVLALVHFSDELGAMGDEVDFERILPLAMREFIPAGLLGLLIAALLAAFMSTYSATVNAAPAYVVNDIYKRYLDPHASEATYVRISYVTSVVVVVVGTLVGLATRSLNDIVQWLVTALYGGYAAANMLKWYWWRFNSYGYFWGMASGIVAASIIPLLLPHVIPLYAFPAVLGLSLCGCVVGSLMTLPDDLDVLKKFYHKVRPWGWWQPIQDLVVAEHPDAAPNRNFGRDLFNTGVGMIWQACLISLGIYVVLKDMTAIMWSVGILLITSLILKFNWLDKLEDYPPDLA